MMMQELKFSRLGYFSRSNAVSLIDAIRKTVNAIARCMDPVAVCALLLPGATAPIVGETIPTAIPDKDFDADITIKLGDESVLPHRVAPSHFDSMVIGNCTR